MSAPHQSVVKLPNTEVPFSRQSKQHPPKWNPRKPHPRLIHYQRIRSPPALDVVESGTAPSELVVPTEDPIDASGQGNDERSRTCRRRTAGASVDGRRLAERGSRRRGSASRGGARRRGRRGGEGARSGEGGGDNGERLDAKNPALTPRAQAAAITLSKQI